MSTSVRWNGTCVCRAAKSGRCSAICARSLHGESDAAVIERLGPAAAYADTVSAPLGGKRRAGFALPAAVLALAVVLIAVFLAAQAGRPPENVIGQADAVTQIRVTGGVDLAPVFLTFGLLAAAVAAVLFALRIRRRKGDRE